MQHPGCPTRHHPRHLGNTLAGEAEGSLRELADRMSHSTTRAALSYQHCTSLRDKMIADQTAGEQNRAAPIGHTTGTRQR